MAEELKSKVLLLDRFQIIVFHSSGSWMMVRVQSQCSVLDTGKTGSLFHVRRALKLPTNQRNHGCIRG